MKNSLLASFTILFLLAVFLGPDGLTASRRQEEPSVALSNLAKNSTVFIKTDSGTGSGFVIANEYVATHHRVIAEAKSISVRLIGSSEELEGALVVGDAKNSLAIIRVRSLKAPPLILSRNRLEQSSKVYVYDNPQGLEGSFSSGEVATTWGNKFIQITAPISPGSSGGPVFDSSGHVIGVTAASIKGSQNRSLVIPIFQLIELARGQVELPESAPSRSTETGRVECSHRIPCVHQVACVHEVACDHRVPCSHRRPCIHHVACIHVVACQHLDRTPYGLQAAHPQGHAQHTFDYLHASDLAHPFDTLHPFHTKHPHDYAHEFDKQHEYDYVTP